jgi:tetratricopeptide (TPR) repeat protein
MTSPQELLRRRRYRTPVFLRIYLDHVEEIRFRDPRAGLRLAKVAPQLARLVPKAAGDEGQREHREHLVRAHAALASAYRLAGREAAAESEYDLAIKTADSGAMSPLARADLSLRLATRGRDNQSRQEGWPRALELVGAAEAAYRAAGDRRRLAEAYAVRGYILNEAKHFTAAIPWHGKALKLALSLERAKPADPADVAALARVVEAARTNMAHAVSQAPGTGFAATVFAQIKAAHRELRDRRNSLTRHLLQWTEGKVYLRLDRPDRAEKRFKVARRGFVRLEAPWETALVSLDLAALYRESGRWDELLDLAADTSRRFRELCGDFEAIAALSLWVDAVQARHGVAAAIEGARDVVAGRMTGR